jgi:hypothetical protein
MFEMFDLVIRSVFQYSYRERVYKKYNPAAMLSYRNEEIVNTR